MPFKEEMLLAVEKANDALQQYAIDHQGNFNSDAYMEKKGLCDGDDAPLSTGDPHNINCMLPAICDTNANHSEFSYTVTTRSQNISAELVLNGNKIHDFGDTINHLQITYNISCNGYTL